ncbi:Zn-dependent hydrolase [Achromobacter piechaudii]|uniref:N-carbamoyl-L-amino-acid hydrolase n=1 Tax=Achromobacter piechaudii TaxID=72556 RepID=A0A6S7EPH7_9BURK|nr:Zn-dependent hydrolase [Achromobacter piechaudii]KNY10696.1 allantoate amidohydrolase [Achromobacter piechaudii]CAB3727987.1 N-carbamoyl-L-amino-acid hydrolase [Achromobacter piechaudii]CAB3903523.1 N-carbamoyl-L-amino-acid hydrolase [Achromobacter piechaudii]CAB3916571.1 N-carbamoyl-L-amino-acid hydrolase [Achromobacter piechaudii]CAB3956318.1 N-carbamoyl-L-amino-acid hydrolase [Achromobacter piechaudii]
MTTSSLSINGQRLWQSLMDLARIGSTPKGGNCRLALTELDGQGRDLVTGWMREAGMTVRVDQVGNIFARRAGRNNDLPPVMTGSHIDTQPTGGKFDGCYGVLAGLEVMRTLNDAGIQTEAPLEVAIWTNEEGSRFVPVMMGSGVFAGKFTLETALSARDAQGICVRDELAAIGYAGTDPVGGRPVDAYFEAHIEQGPILEHEEKTIGVVTGSLGLRWYDITVTGMEMHAGPTPMPIRRDALFAASFLVQTVINIANAHQPHGRGTVGEIHAHPGSRNVIPGQVRFTADLRHEDEATLTRMDQQWRRACDDIAVAHGVQVELKDVQYFRPTPFDPDLVDKVRRGAASRGLPAMNIVTGAGHDAVYMAAVAPTAMIFVPCKDGISHNEIEDAQPEHLEAGCNVLLDAMVARANAAA